MPDHTSSNRKIVSNTMVLFLRMIIVLGVNLYISRVVLATLGIDDFGIYNVVGSIVVMFSYMNSALALATTRFYSYEMHNGLDRMIVVYNTSRFIQLIFAAIIVILSETIGTWLLNFRLVIPGSRLLAANWVFQFSVLTTIFSIVGTSYNSAIIAYENMSVYAAFSIIDIGLKLFFVITLSHSDWDKLVFYAFGICLISVILYFLKLLYCKKTYPELQHHHCFDKVLFGKMFSFVGWNFFGATAGMSVNQGLNIVLNVFFGPVVNAARGIALQVQSAVDSFVLNINTAINPQIVKRYSIGDYSGMITLAFFSSKVSFLILLVVSLPLIVDTPYLIRLWLTNVPDNAILFTRLILVYSLTLSVVYSINMSAQASGNIKKLQLVEGGIVLLNLPMCYLLFRLDFPAYFSFISMILFSLVAYVIKIHILKEIIDFPITLYIRGVIFPILFISLISTFIFVLLNNIVPVSFFQFICKTFLYYIPLTLGIWFLAFTKDEREKIIMYIKQLLLF